LTNLKNLPTDFRPLLLPKMGKRGRKENTLPFRL
jgi:hypothetical protein